ncbi:MAG: hypothetical protein HMLKMBBP_01325 [Planctomycetes bacterium]|nr:hypothetical protein [Planctomycetota bacterium]
MRRDIADGVCEIDYVDPSAVAGARKVLPDEADLRRAADAFQAMAHPGRLRILKALHGRELCVCDIASLLGISMSGASTQLRELRNLGAVEYRVAGKLAYYTVADSYWLELAESVLARIGRSEPTARSRRRSVPA